MRRPQVLEIRYLGPSKKIQLNLLEAASFFQIRIALPLPIGRRINGH